MIQLYKRKMPLGGLIRLLMAIALGTASAGERSDAASAAPDETRPSGMHPVPEDVHNEMLSSPKNLARWHMGTRLYTGHWGDDPSPLEWGDSSPDPITNLLEDDVANETPLPAGETDVVIDLGRFYRLDTVRFLNQGVRGSLRIQGANALHPPESRRWSELSRPISIDRDGIIGSRFPVSEARFLRLRFDVVDAGGGIAAFYAAGDARIADAAPVLPPAEQLYQPSDSPLIGFDFATLPAGARITHVSSGDPRQAASLIDDDPESEYRFLLEDGDSIFIIEYMDVFRFEYASMVMDAGRGTMEVYGMRRLPEYLEASTETEVIYLPDAFFTENAPAVRYELERPARHLRLNLNGLDARYMLVRFQGINNPTPSFAVSKFSAVGSIPRGYAQHVVAEVFEFAEPDADPAESGADAPDDPPRLAPASP